MAPSGLLGARWGRDPVRGQEGDRGRGVLHREEFRKHHPGIRFENTLPTSDAAMAALISGAADLAPAGREPVLTEILAFETFGHHATEITIASGAYDVEGMSCGLIVCVHEDNPIRGLTMKQLDGIFGAERTGAYRGFKWMQERGRPASEDLRTWGQLGLGGEWADKPIHTYGQAPSGTTSFFQLKALDGCAVHSRVGPRDEMLRLGRVPSRRRLAFF